VVPSRLECLRRTNVVLGLREPLGVFHMALARPRGAFCTNTRPFPVIR
jgi:hypothetical protein